MLIKTGIAGFDEFLRGGLPPSVILLTGEPGSGSDVFVGQILYTRASKAGVTYFTVNKSPQLIKEELSIYGWNVSKLKDKGVWKFIDLGEVKSLSRIIIKEMKDNWVAVDSFSDLLLTHDVQEVIALLNSMSSHNRKYRGLNFVLLTEGMHDPKVEMTLEHFADGVINFQVSRATDILSRRLMIKKMRRTIAPTRSLLYSVGETGIIVETAMRIT